MIYTSLSIFCLMLGAVICAPELVQPDRDGHSPRDIQDVTHEDHMGPLEKRSPHYNFGLGKRAYSYVSEYKRLPVYNFGLGKRSRPYSFGLGKRSADEMQADDDVSNDADPALAELFDQYDDAGYQVKRARPYSFGLGKRFAEYESEEKRAKYDFGLGKRLPLYNFGLGKRARNYDFGLGKRLSKFNFGLGKRERDMHRFSFGLGKRSAEEGADDESDSYFET